MRGKKNSKKIQKQPPEVFHEKGVLRNFTKFAGKRLCHSFFFNKVAGQAWNFVKKETLAQVLSCESCEISKNTFLQNTSGQLLVKIQKNYGVTMMVLLRGVVRIL